MNQSPKQVSIWHNPQCSKSREALKLLEENGVTPQVVRYLETPPSTETLDRVLTVLGFEPRQLMRTKEPLYRELGLANSQLSRQELIMAIVAKESIQNKLYRLRRILVRPLGAKRRAYCQYASLFATTRADQKTSKMCKLF